MKVLRNCIALGIAGMVSISKINCNSKDSSNKLKNESGKECSQKSKYDIYGLEQSNYSEHERNRIYGLSKNREYHVNQLATNKEYDIVIIGGNEIGAACLLEGASRGLHCALVTEEDFESMANCTNHPIICRHAGISYIPYIIRQIKQLYYQVNSAPYLSNHIKIVLPCHGCKQTIANIYKVMLYSILSKLIFLRCAFDVKLHTPKFISKDTMKMLFPNQIECFGFMVEDVQALHNRRLINLLLTATIDKYNGGFSGANICNHMKILKASKLPNGNIGSLEVEDKIKDRKYCINGKLVINCSNTTISPKDPIEAANVITLSINSHSRHIDNCFTHSNVDPTILLYKPSIMPSPNRENKIQSRKENVIQICADEAYNPSQIGENIISTAMAKLPNTPIAYAKSVTNHIKLYGSYTSESLASDRFQSNAFIEHYITFLRNNYGLSTDMCRHLVQYYGTKSIVVAELGKELALNQQLSTELPYLKSEVVYVIRYEMAFTLQDIIIRRLGIDVSNKNMDSLIEPVSIIMQNEFKWSDATQTKEIEEFRHFLNSSKKM